MSSLSVGAADNTQTTSLPVEAVSAPTAVSAVQELAAVGVAAAEPAGDATSYVPAVPPVMPIAEPRPYAPVDGIQPASVVATSAVGEPALVSPPPPPAEIAPLAEVPHQAITPETSVPVQSEAVTPFGDATPAPLVISPSPVLSAPQAAEIRPKPQEKPKPLNQKRLVRSLKRSSYIHVPSDNKAALLLEENVGSGVGND